MGSLRLLYNAKIYQSSGKSITWMTFNSLTGYITTIGREDPPITEFSDSDRCDCNGKLILPGLHESHLHVEKYGQFKSCLNLRNCNSVENFKERIKTYAAENPERKWIFGIGWEQDIMGRYPTKDDIDEVHSTSPVVLLRVCGHVGVINGQALSLAGITSDSEDPPGGTYERYPPGHRDQGKPSGVLKETALDSVLLLIQETSVVKKRNIEMAVSDLVKNGVTSAHACEQRTWNEFCELVDEGKMPIRIFFSGYFHKRDPQNFPSAKEARGKQLSCDRVKLFVDGALGTRTAALSHTYCCSADNKGILHHSQDNLTHLIKESTGLGFRLEIHVIGDDAAEKALDALKAAEVSPEKRPILTHCQILRADLLHRMKEQGVIANIQPQFVFTDSRWLPELLPPELMPYAYAWKSLLNKGIPCAGGSDAPVEPPLPLLGIYDAIFRQEVSRSLDNKKVFRPDECLSVQEAIDLYTKGGAYASMTEDCLGQLLPGYQADFIILDKDICSNPSDLLTSKVLETWVSGKRCYNSVEHENE